MWLMYGFVKRSAAYTLKPACDTDGGQHHLLIRLPLGSRLPRRNARNLQARIPALGEPVQGLFV
jgi:hypothetical protein